MGVVAACRCVPLPGTFVSETYASGPWLVLVSRSVLLTSERQQGGLSEASQNRIKSQYWECRKLKSGGTIEAHDCSENDLGCSSLHSMIIKHTRVVLWGAPRKYRQGYCLKICHPSGGSHGRVAACLVGLSAAFGNNSGPWTVQADSTGSNPRLSTSPLTFDPLLSDAPVLVPSSDFQNLHFSSGHVHLVTVPSGTELNQIPDMPALGCFADCLHTVVLELTHAEARLVQQVIRLKSLQI